MLIHALNLLKKIKKPVASSQETPVNDTSGEEASSARGVGQRREVAAHTPAHRTKPPDLKKRRCSGSASLIQIPFAVSAQQFCARVAWSV
jgi:hypothetical protein